jgi:hypothetical protein
MFFKRKKTGGGKSSSLDSMGFPMEKDVNPADDVEKPVGGVQSKRRQTRKKTPAYVEAWGWAAAAARFRGILIVFLIIILVGLSCAMAITSGMLKNKQIMVVGLHEDGQPQILERRSIRDINPELFMRDFTAHFLNYTALTCEENLQYAARFFSDGFRSSWNSRFGGIQDFAKTIRDEDVVQVVSVDRVEIVGMDKRGLEAKVWGTRYRSSALLPKPKAEKILFEFDVLRGTISSRNPWGLYISTLKERSYE